MANQRLTDRRDQVDRAHSKIYPWVVVAGYGLSLAVGGIIAIWADTVLAALVAIVFQFTWIFAVSDPLAWWLARRMVRWTEG